MKSNVIDKKNCVYKFLDENNKVIYIGKCKSLKSRFSSHKNEPHLDPNCYAKIRRIEYISYNTYMDAGLMERIFIAYYKPKYNVQYTHEGNQSILSVDQIKTSSWTILNEYPNGSRLMIIRKREWGY